MSNPMADPDAAAALSIALAALPGIYAGDQATLDTILSGILTNHSGISEQSKSMILAKMSTEAKAAG